MRGLRMLAIALALASPRAIAAAPAVEGDYDSPLGRVRVSGDGTTYRAVLVEPAAPCPFLAGEEVLRATLLDDSLAGQVRVWLRGKACRAGEQWGSAVLLVQEARLSGAVHVAAKGCAGPALGKKGGIAFERVGAVTIPVGTTGTTAAATNGATTTSKTTAATTSTTTTADPTSRATPALTTTSTPTSTSTATATAKTIPSRRRGAGAREQARAVLRDGAAYLQEGNFEAARRRFLDAIEIDARIPEAYNGVGVTFRMRNDLARALDWYKKALAVDPDFGDAYYNMACVYALRGEKEMALRYLQIAALNGYATAEGIGEDPDLEPIRSEPGYRALVRANM